MRRMGLCASASCEQPESKLGLRGVAKLLMQLSELTRKKLMGALHTHYSSVLDVAYLASWNLTLSTSEY